MHKLSSSLFLVLALVSSAFAAEEANVIAGKDGWYFLPADIRYLGADLGKLANATTNGPLAAIVDFDQQLKSRQIELIFLPVPPKSAIYSETLPTPVTGKNQKDLLFAALEKRGVTVKDYTEIFQQLSHSKDKQLYCRQDSHWSPYACEVVAKSLAEIIKTNDWYKHQATKIKFTANQKELVFNGDLPNLGGFSNVPPERLAAQVIDGPTTDNNSPILLLGDSHNLIFHAGGDMLATNCGVADQLAFELGMPIDVLGVRGSGATPCRINLMRRCKANPNYLQGKKLVIWCLSAKELTENPDWRIVPLGK